MESSSHRLPATGYRLPAIIEHALWESASWKSPKWRGPLERLGRGRSRVQSEFRAFPPAVLDKGPVAKLAWD